MVNQPPPPSSSSSISSFQSKQRRILRVKKILSLRALHDHTSFLSSNLSLSPSISSSSSSSSSLICSFNNDNNSNNNNDNNIQEFLFQLNQHHSNSSTNSTNSSNSSSDYCFDQINIPENDQKLTRKERNRMSAKASRDKKNYEIVHLSDKVNLLQNNNELLLSLLSKYPADVVAQAKKNLQSNNDQNEEIVH